MLRSRRFVLRTAALAGAGFAAVPATFAQSGPPDVLSRDSVLRDPAVPAIGNPAGDVTIVEYFDYQCPFCRKVHGDLTTAMREDGKVRLVLKNWPIFGGISVIAAKMQMAATYQGKHAEAHEALITTTSRLDETVVRDRLAAAGIDLAKLADDMTAHGPAIEATLARIDVQAKGLGFPGTPGFIVGRFRIPGVIDLKGFRQVIKDARAHPENG